MILSGETNKLNVHQSLKKSGTVFYSSIALIIITLTKASFLAWFFNFVLSYHAYNKILESDWLLAT